MCALYNAKIHFLPESLLFPYDFCCSVLFNFLGRDFFNALSEKDVDRFYQMLVKWVGALFLGIPVFVARDFFQSSLSLDWRNWMTREITADYFSNRAFYQVQAGDLVDNPDQRIASDARWDFWDRKYASDQSLSCTTQHSKIVSSADLSSIPCKCKNINGKVLYRNNCRLWGKKGCPDCSAPCSARSAHVHSPKDAVLSDMT